MPAPNGTFGRVQGVYSELAWVASSKVFIGLLRYYQETGDPKALSNIEMTKVCQPIMVLASRFAFSKHHQTRRPPIGHIRNVRFEHIKAVVGDGGILRSKSGWEAPYKRFCSAVVSGPGSRIEDISFSDIDITFPGGGTAEQASRLDVGELLEAFEYIKWAVPFDGELPPPRSICATSKACAWRTCDSPWRSPMPAPSSPGMTCKA